MAVKNFDDQGNIVADVYTKAGDIYRKCDLGPVTIDRTFAFWIDDTQMHIIPMENINQIVFYEIEEETKE